IAVPAIVAVWMWFLAIAAASVAFFAVKRPALRAMAFLPWVVSLEPTLSHSPLGDSVWTPERLDSRCDENDGVRPVNVRPELRGTRYFGVTVLSPELLLLHGERHSMWVRRNGGTSELAPELGLTGNFWEGCVRDGSVW